MSDDSFSDDEMMMMDEEKAAMVAAKLEDDNFYQLQEDERELLIQLSKKNAAEFDAQLKKNIFNERKTKQHLARTGERDRKRLLFIILVALCEIDPKLALILCSFVDSKNEDGGSSMGICL